MHSHHSYRLGLFTFIAWMLAFAPAALAQETFDDGGPDSNWSTDMNWLDDTAPDPMAAGDLIFNQTTTATADQAYAGITSIESAANSPTLTGMMLSFTGGAAITNNSADPLMVQNDLFITDTSLTINAASGNIVIDNAGAGTLDTNGNTLILDGANNISLGHVISGAGGLTKNGAGTSTLTGVNTFEGPVQINAGTLAVSGGSAVADTVAVTVAGGGTLQLDANETIGSLAGAGMVDLGTSQLIAGDANDTTFSGMLTSTDNTGTFFKTGTGTLTLSGVNTLTGQTSVGGGTLNLTGAVGGDLGVGNPGATLIGTGTISGRLFSVAGGTIAPATDGTIGTLTTGGDFDHGAGADLAIDISKDGGGAITNDQVDVGGASTVTANSTISLTDLGGGGTFTAGDTVTVITTTGGMTDNGVTVNDDLAFLVWNPMVNGTNLDLVLAAGAEFVPLATGSNNTAIAGALDVDGPTAAGAFATYVNALIDLGGGTALNDALQQSSPLAYAAAADAGLRITQRHAEINTSYLRGRRAGSPLAAQTYMSGDSPLAMTTTATNPMLLAASMDQMVFETASGEDDDSDGSTQSARPATQPAQPEVQDERVALFDNLNIYGTFFGVFDDHEDRIDYAGFQANTAGAQFGVDTRLRENLITGLMLGVTHTQIDLDNGGDGDATAIRVGPYATWQPMKRAYVDASLTYGFHMNDIDRNVSFAGFSGQPNGDYDAHDVSAYIGTGYDIPYEQFTLTPFASLQYTWQFAEGFTESGGGGAALRVDDRENNSLRSRLGVRVNSIWEIGEMRIAPEAFVAWGHEFLGDDDIDANFAGGSTQFTISPSESDSDSLYTGVGFSTLIDEGISAFLRYEAELSSDIQTHGIGAGLSMMF